MSDKLKEQLDTLRQLRELGFLTEAEFDAERRKVVDAVMGRSGGESTLSGATVAASSVAASPGDDTGLSGPTTVGDALPTKLGSYRVLELVGAGGMGTATQAAGNAGVYCE